MPKAIAAYADLLKLEAGNEADYLEKAILEEATGDWASAVNDYANGHPFSPQAYQLAARWSELTGDPTWRSKITPA